MKTHYTNWYVQEQALLLAIDAWASQNPVNYSTTIGKSCITNPVEIEVIELTDSDSRPTCNKLRVSIVG